MNFLGVIRITQGRAFDYEATVQGQDWTGITGVATFKEVPGGDVLLTETVTGDALGVLSFSLSAVDTAELPAQGTLGYRATCIFQIVMSDGQLFQGNVGVAGLI